MSWKNSPRIHSFFLSWLSRMLILIVQINHLSSRWLQQDNLVVNKLTNQYLGKDMYFRRAMMSLPHEKPRESTHLQGRGRRKNSTMTWLWKCCYRITHNSMLSEVFERGTSDKDAVHYTAT